MTEQSIDPVIVDAVQQVENRFGAQGLEDLITLAERHLATARAALEELAEPEQG